MPNLRILTPQAQAAVLTVPGTFTTAWYQFFQNLASDIPQIGDCLVQASGPITNNYFACDGSAINRVQFSALFAVIGTAYGVGDGVTTFNLPTFVTPGAPAFWKIRYQ